ncbi:hypothetical protein DPEC_G00216170 [Dallia pectoralis]|uniref:Uncharacterized protein n=1 Tax=Dallia pectoralis TaxID=75939 RepID=A0ACC2G2F2_DALPE|nr:hypothetical protein DPEC_G00216170 [Dallia pectoralis]
MDQPEQSEPKRSAVEKYTVYVHSIPNGHAQTDPTEPCEMSSEVQVLAHWRQATETRLTLFPLQSDLSPRGERGSWYSPAGQPPVSSICDLPRAAALHRVRAHCHLCRGVWV